MYQQDPSRPEAGMHFHVHQCVCTSQLYNVYRQPLIAPYLPAPLPARPYNLAHYQYTAYNVPYTQLPIYSPTTTATATAIAHQTAAAVPISVTTSTLTMPENVARRHENNQESNEGLRNNEDTEDYSAMDTNTEDFTKFLEQGCIIAEKIAIRNQHRPCFKNIQNLCNRTKNEILKPSHTVSNIHSQGIPWATKDFIYAYVRLINCWHMLKGYLQAKDGALGNIDRELTSDFKNCYSVWESNTKDLAEHMIRIFSNLDNNVSNPSLNQNFVNRTRLVRNIVSNATPPTPETSTQVVESPPQIQSQISEEANQFSENSTEPSPREEESDCEGRIYMKPGSYRIPKKNYSDNESLPIEFLDTAKNVSLRFRKLEGKIHYIETTHDRDWNNAAATSTNLVKKTNDDSIDEEEEKGVTSPHNSTVDVDNIRRWLCHDHFDQQNLTYPLSDLRLPIPDKPVTLLQRCDQKSKEDIKQEQNRMKKLLELLINSDFNKTLYSEALLIKDFPDNLETISHKLASKIYKDPTMMISDLRRLILRAQTRFCASQKVMQQIVDFYQIIETTYPELVEDEFEPVLSEDKS